MSPPERRALLTILALVLAGHGVRAWLLAPGDAPGAVVLLEPSGTAALDRQRSAAAAAGRPLARGERIDLNTATAAELARLPRVGPGMARRIVADRDSKGPFQTLADLDRVPGVGPALLREVGPWVVQSGAVGQGGGGAGGVALPGPSVPGGGGAATRPDGGGPTLPGPPAHLPPLVDLNRATEADLLRLPGIGPTKARAIVAYRQARGPFASVAELVQVPGIGPATLAGLADLVVVR